MTSSRHELVLCIHELDRSIRQALADYRLTNMSINGDIEYKIQSGLIHLSQVTSALTVSPMTPPAARYVTIHGP